MIYSGKESQTVSNAQNGASTTVTTTIVSQPTFTAPFAPQLSRMSSTSSGDTTPEELESIVRPNVYYNARLDPKNFLEGPLSLNPATRLRQMLARPGIVVSSYCFP